MKFTFRWLRRLQNIDRNETLVGHDDQDTRLLQAQAEREKSEGILRHVIASEPRITRHVRDMQNLRTSNGFASLIEEAFRNKSTE
jgi:hypothetical protein